MRSKTKQITQQLQLVLEEHQETGPEITVRIEAAGPDTEMDMGSLPGCLGYHGQPEQGYVCSSCYHQRLCRKTSTPTIDVVIENKR